MDDDMWGRPRPAFADLLPSTPSPEHSDGDEQDQMDVTPVRDSQNSQVQRVVPNIDLPLVDGVPVAELNQMYAIETRGQSLKKFYTTWSNGAEQYNLKFICVFTCPITGEHFACGHWKNDRGVTVVNGVEYWYNTKKIAQDAAAGRALDCFSLRRCHGIEKSPYQRCLDEPYLAGNAPKLPDWPSDVMIPTALTQRNNGASDMPPPKRALNDWYHSFAQKMETRGIVMGETPNENIPRNESYNTWSNDLYSPNTLFTAIFTCHLSGERFASGSVIEEEDGYKKEFWYYAQRENTLIPRGEINEDSNDSNVAEECLGLRRIHLVWYKTKKKAIAAAAARAVDCLSHRDSPENAKTNNRYCKESPYTLDNVPGLWKLVSESVHGVNGDEWASLTHDDRLTTRFGVPDLHCLLEDERDVEHWRARYRERRHGGERTSEQLSQLTL